MSLLRDTHFALIKGNLERKVNSTELCDTSTAVILLSKVHNTVVRQCLYIYSTYVTMSQCCFALPHSILPFCYTSKTADYIFSALSKCAGDLCSSHRSIKSKSWKYSLLERDNFSAISHPSYSSSVHAHVN